MKNKGKRILTFMIALVMCAGMILTDLQAADLGAGGSDNAMSGAEGIAPDNVQDAEGDVQEPDSTVTEPPGQEEPEAEQPQIQPPVQQPKPDQLQIQQPQIQQPVQQSKAEQAPMDDKLASLMSGQATMQTMSMTVATAAADDEKFRTQAMERAGEVPLNISGDSIVLSEGGAYKQGATTGTNNKEAFTIEGTTRANNITVERGANPTITLANNMSIDLTDVAVNNGSTGLPAIDVAPGANVTLVLQGNSTLVGSAFSSAIRVQNRSTVTVKGIGQLTAIGGAGAYAVGNNNLPDGNFGVAEDSAKVMAYSNLTDRAINVQNMYTTVKLLQGALDLSIVDSSAKKKVSAENRNNRLEKYRMELPVGYASFATTTTERGGEYVTYFPKDDIVENSTLLTDASSRYVYGLESLFTTSLSGLKPNVVNLSVTFNANGGVFPNDAKTILVSGIGYGTTIQGRVPETPTRDNHRPDGDWYLNTEGEIEGRWDVAGGQVVKDTVLYANWIPQKCTVTFDPKTSTGLRPFSIEYENGYQKLISEDAVKSVTNKDQTLDGWYTDKGKKWDFATDRLTKETMTLTARWFAPCKVTFRDNIPPSNKILYEETIPATTTIKDPSVNEKPVRAGYIFRGWYTTAQCTTQWLFSDQVTKSMTLYAGWAAEFTKVTFVPGTDATITDPEISVANGKKITEPPKSSVSKEPRKPDGSNNMGTGYELDGWYTDAKLTKAWDFSTPLSTPDGKLTLYAKWRQELCWYTLNAGDSEAQPVQVVDSVRYGSELDPEVLAAKFTKKGHTILNWSIGKVPWVSTTPLTGDIVLTANWTPEKYPVNFNVKDEDEGVPLLDDKDRVQTQTVVYNNSVTKPVYPKAGTSWPGHTFNGWYTKEGGEGSRWAFKDEETPTLIEEPTELYAYWTWDEYTLTWEDGVNGSVTDEKIYRYGDPVEEPAEPTRENYVFQGWYTDPTYTEDSKWDFETSKMTESTTLYAKWIGAPRDLVLHVQYEPEEEGGNGKEITQKAVAVRYGDLLKRADLETDNNPDTKPRLGYTLNGWYTDKEHTDEWDFETDTITVNQNLYAYWTRNVYTVSFFTYDGDKENKIEDQVSYYGLKITKPADPVRKHYTFDTSWYTDHTYEKEWNFKEDTVTDHMTLHAKWIPDIYKLSFETNGGSKLESIDVTYGTYPSDEALATKKEGYVIKSWYRDKEMTIPFDPKNDLVDENMTIYTGWKLEEYMVKFHYMEAKDSKEEEVIEDDAVYNVGNSVTAPTREIEHKNLSNWYREPEFKERWVFKRDKIKGNLDLYAYWSDIEYTVQFETYDGTEIEDEKLIWGYLVEKPEDAVRDGYTFTGWFKDSSQKEVWDFANDFVEGDTTIYAGWNPNMYEVAFDLNGGTGAVNNQKLLFGSYIAKPDDPTKEGYTFKGWKMSSKAKAAEGEIWNFASDMVNGDITLTAQWEEIKTPDNGNTDNGNNNNGNTNSGGSTTGGNNAAGTGTNSTAGGTGSTTGTGTNSTAGGTGSTNTAAADAIKSAAGAVGSILTGDKAPLTYSLVGIFVGAFMIIWTLIRKYK